MIRPVHSPAQGATLPGRRAGCGHQRRRAACKANVLIGILRMGAIALLITSRPAAAAVPRADVFGSHERNTTALIGILYDLKQTQLHQPADGGKRYADIIDRFIVSGFDEALLNHYYRAPLPLYTTQIYIPRMSAEAAPKAFGVEDEVKPRDWVVHYKGQILPPADGTYRFVGWADDLMVVAINRHVVLNASLRSTPLRQLDWKSPDPHGGPIAAIKQPHYGDWIDLSVDHPVDIDILVGERPGGIFQAQLFYEKKGETYPQLGGKPVIPLFQVAVKKDDNRDYLTDGPVWKCLE